MDRYSNFSLALIGFGPLIRVTEVTIQAPPYVCQLVNGCSSVSVRDDVGKNQVVNSVLPDGFDQYIFCGRSARLTVNVNWG